MLQGLQPDLRERCEPLVWQMVEADNMDQVVDVFAQMLAITSEPSSR